MVNEPAVIEDIPDEASQCSLEVKPLSLDEVTHEPDLLPNLEEDMDEVATISSSDATMMVDVNSVDLDDKEIP